MNLREINPLRWTGGTALLGQIARIVIQHRRKVEHDKCKPAERDLSPRWVNMLRRVGEGCVRGRDQHTPLTVFGATDFGHCSTSQFQYGLRT